MEGTASARWSGLSATANSPAEERRYAQARERPVSPRLYAAVRALTAAILRAWFRIRITGVENVPVQGAAILTSNHKNFLDPFFIGLVLPRPLRYLAKIELLSGPLGWLFLRLGAFPVRRGQADAEAMAIATALLERGELVVIFPEGTRVEAPDALGSPHHGAARMALATGAPIVPVVITGTSHLWRGALPRIKRVQITFLAPVTPAHVTGGERTPTPMAAQDLIDAQVWPVVREEYGRLRATPGLITAALTALGLGGGLLARQRRLQARAKPRLLGKVEPRRLRRRRTRERLLRRIHTPR